MNTNIQTGLTALWVALLAVSSLADKVTFEHRVIDDARGHRQVADIDGDGRNDIVALNYDDQDTVIVWYQYPSFEKHLIFDLADYKAIEGYDAYRADDMKLGDLDGDGDMDIVGRFGPRDSDAQGMNLWLENPGRQGGEWSVHHLGESRYVKDIELADFDGDGTIDIAAREHTVLHIWLQNGSARDWRKVEVPITTKEGMTTGDVDADGDVDVILNGYWIETPNQAQGKWVRHDIDQRWFTQNTGNWRDNCTKVAAADINGDGRLDVLISHSEQPGYPVVWYEAPEDAKSGQWTAHEITQIDYCHNLEAADYDGDGDVDVLVGEMPRYDAPYPVAIYFNNGDGLQWTVQQLTDKGNYSAAAGDVGSDGDIDIVGLRSFDTNPIEMWENKSADGSIGTLALDQWTYIEVDNSRENYITPGGKGWWRAFGLAMGDITGDGYADIASGNYFYRNPGGKMDEMWPRVRFPVVCDAMLMVDVDGDEYGDVIAQALPNVYWLEATDKQGERWQATVIAQMPISDHGNAQGYMVGQIVPGGRPEIVLGAGNNTLYVLEIPDNPQLSAWPKHLISEDSYEGVDIADMDGDGLNDLIRNRGSSEDAGKKKFVAWWKNPGDMSKAWKAVDVAGPIENYPDRIRAVDINGDGLRDVVMTEETRLENASGYWFEQPSPAEGGASKPMWKEHKFVTQFTTNSMDAADMDNDGDIDIITGEHRGTKKLAIWVNDGKGNLTEVVVSEGYENHLGARVFDMDGDGDKDIVGICWDDFPLLHLWRNDAVSK